MSGKLKRVDNYKKNETRRQDRLHFERKLQSNLDQYVTRAVTEVVYRVPEDAEAAMRPESGQTTPGNGDNVHVTVVSVAMANERFPIPIEVGGAMIFLREEIFWRLLFCRVSCHLRCIRVCRYFSRERHKTAGKGGR